MIFVSCNIKRVVVENDPKEKGERAVLNFGHTIGHAVEKAKDFSLLHGECVAIGMAAATYISLKKGNIAENAYNYNCNYCYNYKHKNFAWKNSPGSSFVTTFEIIKGQ